MNDWTWRYEGFVPAEERQREALCTTGNGYMATRGALPEARSDRTHQPGTYLAGVFNRLSSEISGRTVTNESIVNAPNWLPLRCRTDGGDWFSTSSCEVVEHHVEVDLRRSVHKRHSTLRDTSGRTLLITQRRFISLRDPHLAVLESTFVPDFDGVLEIESALDGTVRNDGVPRYSDLPDDHLEHVHAEGLPGNRMLLEVRTNDSHIHIVQCARTRLWVDGVEPDDDDGPTVAAGERHIASTFRVELAAGQLVTIEKVVAVNTSRDDGIYSPRVAATAAAEGAADFDNLLERHVTSWSHAWNRCRLSLDGNVGHTARVLNLHVFHLLQTVSKNTAELDAGVPARGLHGEAYRGHIFWDELFIFPFLTLRIPELTRSLLRYRSRRLDQARKAAAAEGFAGAMYPWQSGSDGREETQTLHLNPNSGRWLPDASHLQRHINAAVVYNIWQYWQATTDLEFMRFWGAEMILEIARFWSSAATYNHALDRYEIRGVVGPDEYHEAYPGRDEPGLDNNAYTNVMAVWCILRAFETIELLPRSRRDELIEKMQLTHEELDRWGDVSRKMRLCFHDGDILSQFEGYGDLEELDWEAYRARYGDIGRLDRILEAEGDSPNRYKLAKQADTLMLFQLFSHEELTEILGNLGYECDEAFFERNLRYYEERTSHGSTLSVMVHAWLHARLDRDHSWDLFRFALASDINDVQGGTTAEGIHLGAMAGTVDLVQRCYGGIEVRGDKLRLDPALPEQLHELRFPLIYRRQPLDLAIRRDEVVIRVATGHDDDPIDVEVRGATHCLRPGESITVPLA